MLNDVRRQPLNGGKPDSVVIFLHGLGDSGQGLIDIADEWANELPNTLFLAVDAPEPCAMAMFGFQWFSPDDWTPAVVLQGIQKSAAPLNATIDQVMKDFDLPADRIALVGFSQGTMMALYVGPRRAEKLAGVIGYSGALIGGESLPRELKSMPPILLVHGTEDPVLPFQSMTHAERGLQNVNMNVKSVPCPGLGHSIDATGLQEGLLFLRRAFGKIS